MQWLRTPPTLGGLQFWNDILYRNGWRIQQHALRPIYRLLNANNRCICLGKLDDCQESLFQHVPSSSDSERVVVLLHGLVRTRYSMQRLARYLKTETNSDVVLFGYSSTRQTIDRSANCLRSFVESLPSTSRINFVGHSMGCILVRRLLQRLTEEKQDDLLQRIERVVMLGPPNQGSTVARKLGRTGIFGFVLGAGAMELGLGWEQCSSGLSVPNCEFGIIAGELTGWCPPNPLLAGPSDGVVSCEETKLPGAADYLVVPSTHTFIMMNERVRRAVANFLLRGRFELEQATCSRENA